MDVSNARGSAATSAAERELVITRVFDAPRELVFKAWTESGSPGAMVGAERFRNACL